jgi:hypothetical protein
MSCHCGYCESSNPYFRRHCPVCEARSYDKDWSSEQRKERLIQSVDWGVQVKTCLDALLHNIRATAAPFEVETAWAHVNADPRTRTIDITFNGHIVVKVPEAKSDE